MARSRTACGTLSLVLAWLAIASPSTASDAGFIVIVHPDNPVTSVDSDFLRGAFLKKTTHWRHGPPIRPIGLAGDLRAHDRFTHDVLKKTPAQLRAYWAQRIFSGTDVPPLAADSPVSVIAYVIANPGTVGYLPSDVAPGGAKVVSVK
jgi:ABC-type phosphate transport system substrate-binding protein